MIEGPKPPAFDVSVRPMPLRMTVARWLRRVFTRSARQWALEIGGVSALAVAGWLIFPAGAFIVVGVYAILAANVGGE